jgi:DNA-binding protein YbaB
MKYKVKITRTTICEAILQAEDNEDLNDVVNTAINNHVISMEDKNSKYDVEVESLGK